MSTSAKSARCDADMLWVELTDGRVLGIPLAWFPRLLSASPAQRSAVEIGADGIDLHWEELDEDILVEGLLAGFGDRSRSYRAAAE